METAQMPLTAGNPLSKNADTLKLNDEETVANRVMLEKAQSSMKLDKDLLNMYASIADANDAFEKVSLDESNGEAKIKENIHCADEDEKKDDGVKSAGCTGGGDAPFMLKNEADFKSKLQSIVQQARSSEEPNGSTTSTNPINVNKFFQEIMLKRSLRDIHRGDPEHLRKQIFSVKVFVGGLPPDIEEHKIVEHFEHFGRLVVDWPHKINSRSPYPPKGFAFLIYESEESVVALRRACCSEDDKLYYFVSSPTIKHKPVQIRTWTLADADYVAASESSLDPRKTVFIGGIPRSLKAAELADFLNVMFGNVVYAGVDMDQDLKYPKGVARVTFGSQKSYIAAITARFVQLQYGDFDKRVEIKPYLLDNQSCDECHGSLCQNKPATYFCPEMICLFYYCERCWALVHSRPGRQHHKPLFKQSLFHTRPLPFQWY